MKFSLHRFNLLGSLFSLWLTGAATAAPGPARTCIDSPPRGVIEGHRSRWSGDSPVDFMGRPRAAPIELRGRCTLGLPLHDVKHYVAYRNFLANTLFLMRLLIIVRIVIEEMSERRAEIMH
jgi:hypothetical protein